MDTRAARFAWIIALVVLTGTLVRPADAGGPDVEAAETLVQRLHETLIESMKADDSIDFQARVERLRPTVERTFHFEPISRFVLGRHAGELDPQQLGTIADMLARLSVRQYARHFDRYNGERLEHVGTAERGSDRVMVSTELVKADGERISLDYLLQKHEGRWGVVNVIADGVSDLALKRAEYANALKRDGYAGLVGRLREQIDETEAK